MKSNANATAHAHQSLHRVPFTQIFMMLTVATALSLSGCVGLTGAGTPQGKSNTTSNPASLGTLAANATSFSFGSVAAGSTGTQNLTLTNTGSATVTISQVTIDAAGFSMVGSMSAVTIAAGQSRTFQMIFTPAKAGAVSGNMSITSDATNSPLGLSLSGTGTSTLAITTQPANQSVTAGQTANFSVTASGNGTLSYQRKRNGGAIGGATAASYTTPATSTSDNGAQFTVVVTDSLGSVTSNAATLTVTAAPVAPSITSQPASQTVTAGQTATFSVIANGTAPLTYQWKRNGAPINGATGVSYTTPATSASDNGAQFSVTVSNNVSNATSNAATLTVNVPPSITSQPANQTVTAGQTAAFSVSATGTGTLSYQWKKNGAPIGGATSSSYTTPATAAGDNGAQFSVTVTDSVASVTSNSATLTVNVPPSITSQPASQTVNAGQQASFNVAASGTGPLTYQWKKNGGVIGGANAASYTTPATSPSDSGAQFAVTISSSFGSATSNAATLTVNVPPTITSQPASQTVAVGQTATFSVTASGTGTLSYQWKKNGGTINGATSSSYTTPPAGASDNGAQFTVVVAGNSGNITSNAATLTVNAPPSITAQPASKTVIAGQTATFTVTASGAAPLTYQWNKNSSPINGANSSSYTTPATTTGDNGSQFTVTVSNAAGNTTSTVATLTVTASSAILNASQSSLNFNTVNVGSSSSLPVTLSNAGNSNVTISNVSVSGAGFTASGVSAGQILTPGKNATLNVTFAPSSAGGASGGVTVTSDATNSPISISLSGTGAQPTISHSVTVSWAASASTVSGYNVYSSTVSGGSYTKLNSSLITSTSYTDSTVLSGRTYFYVVTSVDPVGMESVFSAEASATIPTP
jgi:hypothetical protein